MEFDKTMNFKVEREENTKCREVLKEVYQSLVEKGYNPINQIVGYILSGDPTYITSHSDNRSTKYNSSRIRNYTTKWI